MKAILVIDLGDADSDYYFIDYVVRRKETGNTVEIGYNVNLKPLPKKAEYTFKKPSMWWYICEGYNACIDEILGGKDDTTN